ncbi:hypothetical protein JCM6882_002234 [Rhodosporidiobolus microsporus]
MSGQETPAKPATKRATTSSKNRADSPPPYRSTAEVSIEDFVNEFWQHALNVAEHHEDDFKHQALPLARIKKVAKMDPEVQGQMISSEVTVLFEKACQIFIQELTARAHLVSLAARRRTLSRADVASAVSRSDMFDFLIDIVPRAERTAASSAPSTSNAGASTSGAGGSSSKRPSRARKASQRQQEEDEAAAAAEAAEEDAAGAGAGATVEERPPHPLDPMPETGMGMGMGMGMGSGGGDGQPAAKRARQDNGAAGENGLHHQQQQGYYQLPPAFPGAAGGSGGAAAQGAGAVGYPPTGLPQWPHPEFDYAAAATDPALAAFYAAAAATSHQHQQQQQQQQPQAAQAGPGHPLPSATSTNGAQPAGEGTPQAE